MNKAVKQDFPLVKNSEGLSQRLCYLVILIAVLGLLGYIPGLRLLGGFRSDFIPMAPSTAICFLMSSVIILYQKHEQLKKYQYYTLHLIAIFIILFGLLEFIGSLSGQNLTLEDTLLPEMGYLGNVPIGRMSPSTGFGFVLTGLASLFLIRLQTAVTKLSISKKMISAFGLLAITYSSTFFFAYILGTPLLYTTDVIIPMALTTVLGFIFLSLAILLADRQVFPLKVFLERSTRSYLLKYLLPFSIVAVLGTAFLVFRYGVLHDLNPGIMTAIIAILAVMTTTLIVNYLSHHLGEQIDRNAQIIKKQQYHLEKAQEIGKIGTWEIDISSGKIFWTDEVYRIFGLPKDSPVDFELFIRMVHPDDREFVGQEWEKGIAAGMYDIEHRLLIEDQIRWVREKSEFTYDETGRAISALGFTQDITDWKKQSFALENIFNFSVDMICTASMDGFLLTLNPAWEKTLGWTAEELKSKPYVEFVHPDDLELTFEVVRSLEQGKPAIGIQNRYRTKDGDYKWLSWNTIPLRSENLLLGIARDISEQKQAESQLLERNQFIQSVLDNLPIGLAVNHMDKGITTYINKKFEEIYGWPAKDLVDIAHFFECVYPDEKYRAEISQRIMTDIQSGDPERMAWADIEITTREGIKKLVDAKNIPLPEQNLMISTVMDITERRQAEQKLQDSEEKYRMIVEHAHDGIEISQDDRFIFVNPRLAEMLGYTVAELMDKPMSEVFTESAIVALHKRQKTRKSGQSVSNRYDTTFSRKDGSIIHVDVSYEIIDYRGKPATFAIISDISERKRAEAEQVRLEAQLRQAQKVEAVGTMVGGIAHEFNNILQGLFLYSGIVNDRLPEDEDLRSDFQQIVESSNRAKHLVKQILTFSRKHVAAQHPVQIQHLLKESLQTVIATASSAIEIKENIDLSCAPILCDPTQINQVFVNLCNNAVQAMEARGGTLTVSLREVDTPIELEPGKQFSPESGVVELMVQDTGQGMSSETLEHIFDPFYTTKPVGKGTGLGLSIVHELITDMQGQIKVESELNKGTTFTILLPATTLDEEASDDLQPGQAQGRKQLRILFVDDEESISSGAKSILEKEGYAITLAENGQNALALFEQEPGAFDMVITDLSMPEMSGLELGQAIRKVSGDVQIVLSTGELAATLQKEHLALGFDGFIRKPWTAAELVSLINSMDSGESAT